jgi:hypothetical protein
MLLRLRRHATGEVKTSRRPFAGTKRPAATATIASNLLGPCMFPDATAEAVLVVATDYREPRNESLPRP